jgi:ectoine hydroxylase-related dioxygenase (phytanoyl-CoA dioxygenase family)
MRNFSAEFAHFQDHGYVIARNVLPPATLQPLVAEFSAWVDQQARDLHADGKITDLYEELDFDHRVVALYRQNQAILAGMDLMHMRGEACFSFLHDSCLLDLVQTFLGPEISCNPIQHLRAKMPSAVDAKSGFMQVPWHQDVGVTAEDSDDSNIITFWLPLSVATRESGCMEILPDCVAGGCLPHVSGSYGTEIPDDVLPQRQAITAASEPGDVVVMSKYTPHRGLENVADYARWSVDLRFHPTGQPSGRDWQPSFPVRSADHPDSVSAFTHAHWSDAWKTALADRTRHKAHRV